MARKDTYSIKDLNAQGCSLTRMEQTPKRSDHLLCHDSLFEANKSVGHTQTYNMLPSNGQSRICRIMWTQRVMTHELAKLIGMHTF
jgi:hypothetical protein